MIKKMLSRLILLIVIPVIILTGNIIFHDKQYAFISLGVAVFACVPFFLAFEKGKAGTQKMIMIAVMAALSVVGRLIFMPIPGFKPVTAMVVITAMYFGAESGFMTGALTAVISNFYFGQGPWTPFQMFVWGILGFAAGILANPLKRSKILLALYGVIAGVVYSLLMDVWTVLWYDGIFNFSRYKSVIVSAASYTIIYAVSNVIFLLLLAKPIGIKLERIKDKYGV